MTTRTARSRKPQVQQAKLKLRPKVCDALTGDRGCTAAVYKNGLCQRHYRMDNAPKCALDHCRLPAYSNVELAAAEIRQRSDAERNLVTPENKFAVCENHYRRNKRGSKKWDQPLNRTDGDLVVVTTRVRPEAKETIEKTLTPGKALYSRLAEIIEDFAAGRLVYSEESAAA